MASAPMGPGQAGNTILANNMANSIDADPMKATVRIRIDDSRSESVGTGTIIDTHGDEVLVLTCGHLFRDGKGKSPVTIELFHNGRAIQIPGKVVDFEPMT